jgi:hypothetical protein
MPPGLRDMIRGWFTRAYQAGLEPQRATMIRWLEAQPGGKAMLERSGGLPRSFELPADP